LNLYLSVAPGAPLTSLSAVQFHIVSTPTTDFTVSPSAIALGVDTFLPTGFSFKSITGNDLYLSLACSGDCFPGFAPPGTQNMLIGTLTNAQGVTIDSFATAPEAGGTFLDQSFYSVVMPYQVTIRGVSRIYPEPETALLVGLVLAGLALSARPRGRTA